MCLNRKGTLVRSTVLVFVGGGLMGLSRSCREPSMVIIGRFIVGVHSGRPPSHLYDRKVVKILKIVKKIEKVAHVVLL